MSTSTRTISSPADLAALKSEATLAGLPLIVDVWADWCGPCKAYTPVFEAAAERNPGTAIWAKMEHAGANESAADALGIRALPCTILFSAGHVDKFVGTRNAQFLDGLAKPAVLAQAL